MFCLTNHDPDFLCAYNTLTKEEKPTKKVLKGNDWRLKSYTRIAPCDKKTLLLLLISASSRKMEQNRTKRKRIIIFNRILYAYKKHA